jgi:hypothetical protein
LISFAVGSNTSGAGSSIDAVAGNSEVNMVGALSLGFGEGTATTDTMGTVKEINPLRPSMAAPMPSHIAPLLPLDALPDEDTNTPLEHQVIIE